MTEVKAVTQKRKETIFAIYQLMHLMENTFDNKVYTESRELLEFHLGRLKILNWILGINHTDPQKSPQ